MSLVMTFSLIAGLAGPVAAEPLPVLAGMEPVIVARRGADDAPGHVRRGRGADDAPGHVRRGRGTDDAAGSGRRGRGADDAGGGRRGRGSDDLIRG